MFNNLHFRYFSGKKIILRAQRPLAVNELVSENYGPVFTMKNKEQVSLFALS